jgi:hypothetical protein
LSDSVPVRNDVPRAGREILVLRHHGLRKGGHEEFYRISRDDYWPYFERLGARVVGQWKAIEPGAEDRDDVYRLVRYASFEHWQATRVGQADRKIAGNGPAWERAQQALADRGSLQAGSQGAWFLQGSTAPDAPIFMPALEERYELADPHLPPEDNEREHPVRLDVARPGDEIVELRLQQIAKGGFDRMVQPTRSAVWPWEQKLGARPIGQWRVVYPAAPSRSVESAGHDEVITLMRYASLEHRAAMARDRAVELGGNGPDWRAWREALESLDRLTLSTRVELLRGPMHHSPPMYLPALAERYRRKP